MKVRLTKSFLKGYAKLPANLRKKSDNQLRHFTADIRYPGLYARKMTGVGDIWEARISEHYRFTFQISGDTITLRRIGTHEIYRKP